MPSILMTKKLLEKKGGSTETTTSQVITNPTYDSRLYPNNYPLDYCRIRSLRNDPTIQLARWCVLSQIIHTPWVYVEQEKISSKEMTDLLEENLIPIRDQFLMQSVFGTLDFGWSPFEIVYKPEEGKIVIDKLKQLMVDYTTVMVYVNTGDFAGYANEPFGYIEGSNYIPRRYSANINFEVEGTDWYGYSVYKTLNPLSIAWSQVEDAANRYDRKVAGATWVIYYPVGETPYNGVMKSNDEIAKAILNTLEASGNIGIPDEVQEWLEDSIDKEYKGKWRLELLSDKGGSQSSFIDRQKYLDILKIRAFGLPERSILEGTHGTKEEASVHSDMALSTVDSKHRLICHWFNLYVISELLALNFGEKYRWAVRLRPAPLVDNQFATLREMYRLILQTPQTLHAEVQKLDIHAMRKELGLPAVADQSILNLPNYIEETEKDPGEDQKSKDKSNPDNVEKGKDSQASGG